MIDEKEALDKEMEGYKQEVVTDLKFFLELDEELIFNGMTQGGYDIDFDANKQMGLMPTESLLASITACMAIDVVAILRKMRAEITGFKMESTATRNARPPQYIQAVNLLIKVKGKNITDNKMKRAISLSKDKYCSVYHSLRKDLKHEVNYEITTEE